MTPLVYTKSLPPAPPLLSCACNIFSLDGVSERPLVLVTWCLSLNCTCVVVYVLLTPCLFLVFCFDSAFFVRGRSPDTGSASSESSPRSLQVKPISSDSVVQMCRRRMPVGDRPLTCREIYIVKASRKTVMPALCNYVRGQTCECR